MPIEPSRVFQRAALAAGLGARADVDVVDHDLADLVDDQVGLPYLAVDDEPGGVLDLEGDADAAGEVVAGPQRQQRHDRAAELVAAVQHRHHGVQAAVAARHHDPS